MNQGIYEALVTKLVSQKLNEIDRNEYFIEKTKIDKAEAARFLGIHLAESITNALKLIEGESQVEQQIEIANKIIQFLKDELNQEDISENLIETEGEILKAVFTKVDAHFSDFNLHLKEITPQSRLTQSELFTGGNNRISLESELKKEILSSNRINLLVSFIKFKGVIILEQ
jgi:hypothetical protein